MKGVLTKIPAMIGMILSLVTFFYLTKAFMYSVAPSLFDDGSPIYDPELTAWGSGIFALLVSGFSTIFYGIDAILSTAKAFMKIDRIFNAVLATILFICIPYGVWVLCSVLDSFSIAIWHTCYFIMGISKYSARGEWREVFSSDTTKIRARSRPYAKDFCEVSRKRFRQLSVR